MPLVIEIRKYVLRNGDWKGNSIKMILFMLH